MTAAPIRRVLDAAAAGNPRQLGDRQWQAKCPAHDDKKPSLSIGLGDDDRVLLKCHAGCELDAILAELGLDVRDLFLPKPEPAERRIVATYGYYDERGTLLFEAVRMDPKAFRQRRPDNNGELVWNLNGTRRVLYRLPAVLEAVATGNRVWIVEGEKDVDALQAALPPGEVATTNPMGAGKWRPEYTATLEGGGVIIWADADDVGRRHARQVASALEGVAATVRIVESSRFKDAAEHLGAGLGIHDVIELHDDHQDDDAQEWDPPVPLGPTGPLPSFPLDALPRIFADQVAEVAEFTQTDPGMAGASAIAVLGACVGGRCEIQVRPGWREPLGIYIATIAEPGERKSAVQATMVAPLTVAERALMDQARGQILEAEVAKDVANKAAERAKQAAGNSDGANHDDLTANAVSAAMAAEAITVPTVPRIIADDVTPEAAASLMVDQAGRLAIISAEGGIFDIIAGRYSGNVPNLDVFLKGHSGDPLKVDRKGRAPEYVPRPTMTVGIMVQPAVLDALGRNGTFRGRGLLARFLFVLPPSKVGRRVIDPDPVREVVRDQYDATVTKLAMTLAGWVDPAIITLDPEATELIFDQARRTEPRLGPGGDLHGLRDWGSKLVGATARLAGLLHLAANPENGWRQPVTANTVSNAIKLADYFTAHAVRAFGTMATDPMVADAIYLVEIIVRIDAPEVSRRDLFNAASRSRFPKARDLDPVIGLLEDHGHLAPIPPPDRTGPGRRPSPRWTVNPHVLAAQTA